MTEQLPASVLVCTRNRADSLVRVVRSVLGSPERFDLFVIDQSDADESRQALAPFARDARLHYVRSTARGKGAALNEGLRLARSEVVVCTDDDCEAPPSWVADMAGVLSAQPRTAVLFCNVVAPPHDRSRGYVPAYERTTDRRLSRLLDARAGIGLGAGVALRREAVLAFGGYDETFGPGAPFRSGDDWDLALRAIMKGWDVYETSSLWIRHHGFRTLAEGREHALRDWIAIGALCAKPIRAGYASGVLLSLWLFTVEALWPPLRALARLQRPSGLSRIRGFAAGFAQGLAMPLDPRTLAFEAAPSSTTMRSRSVQ